ncbi:hypothetical protein JKP76_03495 [Blastococcus sp. TML/C7B]|uniref:LGFP repeat-containing protein n=1 Tax=Blastococcus sp. TML/C7B TaxID=2798728 RepID=UPI00190917F0|nr:hypothetical protein [Blastococcus sp. TML/C7B]MBN1095182.1 hypothetical protein [Blastococcus sp. TML/C7B]
MSRSSRARRRTAASLLSAAVAAVVTFGGTAVATADVFQTPTGPQHVNGAILATYRAQGGTLGPLSYPITGERGTPDGLGRYNLFQRGGIYWTPWTGAHAISGQIWSWYALLGWEAGPLGYPITSELSTPDGRARFTAFQHGVIYQLPQRMPRHVRGAIYQRYASLGWETSPLGYPLTDELGTPDGRGRFNDFQGGLIYWTPWTGAHAVWGSIRQAYGGQGFETGRLGYPVTSELPTGDGIGRFNHFERGSIYWTSETGAHPVAGEIRDTWAALGWENSELGYPTTDEYAVPDGGRVQEFEFGWIELYPGDGAAVYLDS